MARPSPADQELDEQLSLIHAAMMSLLNAANEIGLTLHRIYRLEPRLLDHTDYAERWLSEMVLVVNQQRAQLEKWLNDLQTERSDHNRKPLDE